MRISRFRFLAFSVGFLALGTALPVHAQEQDFVEQVSENVPAPNEDALSQDTGNGQSTFVDGNTEPDLPMDAAPAPTEPDFLNDNFFDAEDLVPQSEQARSLPTEVDPAIEPGSKLIIVKKHHDAGSVPARLVSAERALALGRYDSALQMFNALYEQNSKDKRTLMGRAVTLQKMGRYDEAMQTYDAFLELDPDNLEVRINMLGLLSTRYPAVALRNLLELHHKNPTNVGLTAQIAVAYASSADTNSALRYLGMAASMEPENANHVYNMAIISDRAGRKKEALKYYEQALDVDTMYGGGRTIPRESVYTRMAQIR